MISPPRRRPWLRPWPHDALPREGEGVDGASYGSVIRSDRPSVGPISLTSFPTEDGSSTTTPAYRPLSNGGLCAISGHGTAAHGSGAASTMPATTKKAAIESHPAMASSLLAQKGPRGSHVCLAAPLPASKDSLGAQQHGNDGLGERHVLLLPQWCHLLPQFGGVLTASHGGADPRQATVTRTHGASRWPPATHGRPWHPWPGTT